MILRNGALVALVFISGCWQPFAYPKPGSQVSGPHAVSGTVFSGVGPATLDGAVVQLFGPVNRAIMTQGGGLYAFSGLPPGEYRLEVTAPGFLVYPHGTHIDSRLTVDGVETRNFRSVVFSPSEASVTIQAIQGRGHLSPLIHQEVTNVVGVVTGVEYQDYFRLDFPWYGIYIQSFNPDADERTSEGLFVYMPQHSTGFTTIPVGSLVNIKSGVVEENRFDFPFLESGYRGNLSRTWVRASRANVEVLLAGSGVADPKIPPPISVGVTPGAGKRIIPDRHSSVEGNVESPAWDFDPEKNAVDFWESLEGMRVSLSNLRVVEPTSEFGDIFVSPDNGVGIVQTTDQGGALLQSYSETNARLIQIGEYSFDFPSVYAALPNVGIGGSISNAVGNVDYSRNTYMVRALSVGTASGGVSTQETTTLSGSATHLTVATMNLKNFWALDARANGFGTVIRDRMLRPDIIGLVEVQDNTGEQDDGTVAADLSLQALITAIGGSPLYLARQVNPLNNRSGGAPGGNIRAAFLYNPSRVSFVDRSAGSVDTSLHSVQVVSGPTGPVLSWSPGLIGAGETLFDHTRKPLVGEFLFSGKRVFVIVAHLNSKIGDGAFFGPNHPIPRPSEQRRHPLARHIADFIRQIRALDAGARVVVVGDLNDFHFSRTLSILEGAGMHNLHFNLPVGERFTFKHLGNSQTLDHILVSHNLVPGTAFDVVRVFMNIPFSTALSLSDHEPILARIHIP